MGHASQSMRGEILWLSIVGLALLLNDGRVALAERVALVIGNSQYQHIRTLNNPHNDAQAVGAKLKTLGFTLVGPVKTQGVYYDLDESDFLKVRNAFERQAAGAQIVLLYYAGHGMQIGGHTYLLPVDVPSARQAEELEWVARRSIDLDSILRRLDGKGELTVAIFDACREIPELEPARRAAGFGETRGLLPVQSRGKNRIVAYSAAVGQFAEDGGGGQHSLYTNRLLAYLDKPGYEVGEIFRQVSYEVGQKDGQQPEVLIQGVPPRTYYLVQGGEENSKNPPPTPAAKPSVYYGRVPVQQPVPPVAKGRTFKQDPLLPREYSSGYPAADDPYAAPQGVVPAKPSVYYGRVPIQPYGREPSGGYNP